MFHWLNLYVIRYHCFLRNRKKRMRGGSEWKQHKSGIQRIINSGECMQRKIVAFIYDHLSKLYKNHTLVLAFKHNEIHGQCHEQRFQNCSSIVRTMTDTPRKLFQPDGDHRLQQSRTNQQVYVTSFYQYFNTSIHDSI